MMDHSGQDRTVVPLRQLQYPQLQLNQEHWRCCRHGDPREIVRGVLTITRRSYSYSCLTVTPGSVNEDSTVDSSSTFSMNNEEAEEKQMNSADEAEKDELLVTETHHQSPPRESGEDMSSEKCPASISSLVGGPFVRFYPRYRVDLTRVKRVLSPNEQPGSSSPVKEWLEQMVGMPSLSLPFSKLVSFSSTAAAAAAAAITNQSYLQRLRQDYSRRFPTLEEIQIVVQDRSMKDEEDEGFPTCHAMKELWQAAATVQTDGGQRLVVLADPSLAGVARNFVDLMEWTETEAKAAAGMMMQPTAQESWEDKPHLQTKEEAIRPPSMVFPVHAEYVPSPNPNDDDKNKRKGVVPSSPAAVYITAIAGNYQSDNLQGKGNTPDAVFGEKESIAEIEEQDAEDIVNERTRAWVQRLLVDLGICPFTKNSEWSGQGLKKEGVPVGLIAYHAFVVKDEDGKSKSTSSLSSYQLLCPLMARTWSAMYDMLRAGPNGKEGGISSILLAAPSFDDQLAFWSGPLFALLEASVVAAQAEQYLGVVCFHPQYAVSDGSSWPGFGHMHSLPRLQQWMVAQQEQEEEDNNKNSTNECPIYTPEEIAAGGAWQRRTPHATINVLRANQLAAAEQVRSSNSLYPRNIQVLRERVGFEQLWKDLKREQARMGKQQHV